MNEDFRPRLSTIVRLIPAVVAGACLAWSMPAAALAADETQGPAVRLSVKPTRDVSELDAEDLETHLTVSIVNKAKCEFRLAQSEETADLTAEVEILRWRERQEPGGAPIFDTGSGRYRPGVRWEIEVRYRFRILDGASGEVLRERERSFVEAAQSRKNPLWDPQFQARLESHRKISLKLRRELCKTVKILAKRAR